MYRPQNVKETSELILKNGFESWKIHLFDFVDDFRRLDDPGEIIKDPPIDNIDVKLRTLIAATVHELCLEKNIDAPEWVFEIPPLDKPWLVNGIEKLRAMSIKESPPFFKEKNILVLDNFLFRV